MGLYDYIGDEQVKCFYTSNFMVDSKNNMLLSYGASGNLQRFSCRKPIPYRTSYYNYGPNFMIFLLEEIFPWTDAALKKEIHRIKNGKLSRSYSVYSLPKSFEVPCVIGKYGEKINIYSKEQFKECIDEKLDTFLKNESFEHTHNYKELYEIMYKSSSTEEREEAISKIEQLREQSKIEIWDPFTNRWYDSSDTFESNIIGPMISTLELNPINKKELINAFYNVLNIENKNLSDLIDEYMIWQGSDALIEEKDIYQLLQKD